MLAFKCAFCSCSSKEHGSFIQRKRSLIVVVLLVVHKLLLLKFNIDLDSDLINQSSEVFNIDITLIIGTSLDNFLDLVKDF